MIDYTKWKFEVSPTPRFVCGPVFVLMEDARKEMIESSPEAQEWLEGAF